MSRRSRRHHRLCPSSQACKSRTCNWGLSPGCEQYPEASSHVSTVQAMPSSQSRRGALTHAYWPFNCVPGTGRALTQRLGMNAKRAHLHGVLLIPITVYAIRARQLDGHAELRAGRDVAVKYEVEKSRSRRRDGDAL